MFCIVNFDDHTNENKTKHNPDWPYIPGNPYRILIIGGSGSAKTNALLNLINKQSDTDKIYLYAKDLYKAKFQYLIDKRKNTGLKHFNDLKAFIEYSNDIQDVYENIDEYNIDKDRKILMVFDDMIADMINNNKLNSIVTELFIRGIKLNMLDYSHYSLFVMKIPNNRELQEIALNHSSDINFKYFFKICKKCTDETYSFLVNDTTLASDNPLRFRKNILNI